MKKIEELKGTSMNRTKLKRVKKSTDAMLGALTESKLTAKADFKANLKTVKKEEEKARESLKYILHRKSMLIGYVYVYHYVLVWKGISA